MTTTTTSGAADLRATFSEMLVDLPNTEPYTLFQAGFDAALAAGQATAAQQASTVTNYTTLGAAMRAIRQSIQMIGDPEDECMRAVKRVLRGAVIIVEDSGDEVAAPAAPAQPVAQQPHRSGCTAGTDEACVQRGCGTNCIAVSPQADSVPAVERGQERIAFKDAHRHLDLDEVPDAWGRPMFKHSHVEASWLGWIARASRGQAPASVLHLVHSAFAEIAMAFPKAFALHKVGIADTAVREALAAPATAQADSVQEDAALWHWLAKYLVGTRTDLDDEIVASETVNDLRKLVEAAIKQGEKQ